VLGTNTVMLTAMNLTVRRRRRRPTGAGLARLPLASVVSRLGSAASCRAVAKPRPAHRRTLRARSSHGARRHQKASLDESAAQPGPRADVGLQPKLMESRVGLDHGDDTCSTSTKAPIGGDQDGVQRYRHGYIEGVTDRDPVHQRPRRQQQGRSGQRVAPDAASASTRSAARVNCPARLRRPNAERTSTSRWAGAATASAHAMAFRKGSAAGKSQIRSTTVAASTTAMLNGLRVRRPRYGQQQPTRARSGRRHELARGLAHVAATRPSSERPHGRKALLISGQQPTTRLLSLSGRRSSAAGPAGTSRHRATEPRRYRLRSRAPTPPAKGARGSDPPRSTPRWTAPSMPGAARAAGTPRCGTAAPAPDPHPPR